MIKPEMSESVVFRPTGAFTSETKKIGQFPRARSGGSPVTYLKSFISRAFTLEAARTSKNNNRRRPFERVRTLVSERNLILLAHDFYNFNPSEARLRKRPRGITFSTTISLREMFCFVFALSYKDKSKHTHRPLNVFVSKPVKLYQSVV